jgi:hypothetical protein
MYHATGLGEAQGSEVTKPVALLRLTAEGKQVAQQMALSSEDDTAEAEGREAYRLAPEGARMGRHIAMTGDDSPLYALLATVESRERST